MRVTDQSTVGNEIAIIWLKPEVQDLPFVREYECTTGHRAGRPNVMVKNSIVAYSEVRTDSPLSGPFKRRVWKLRAADHPYANGSCPAEAVRPNSIIAGKISEPAWPNVMKLKRDAGKALDPDEDKMLKEWESSGSSDMIR